MARVRVPFTFLLLLALGLGLVPGGTNPAAAHAPPLTPAVAPLPVSGAAAAWNLDYIGHSGGVSQAVAAQDNLVYVGEGSNLTLLEVSTHGSLSVLGQTAPLPGIVSSVAVAGGYAYVGAERAGLRVIDVSLPSAPVEVGFYHTPGIARGVAAGSAALRDGTAGGYVYVAAGEAGLRVVDVSTPLAPVEVGFYDTPGWAWGVAVQSAALRDSTAADYAYVADHTGLRVVDVSTPSAPAEVGFYDTPGEARDVAVAGQYAYVADAGDAAAGLRVVDVSTPSAPVEVGALTGWGSAYAVGIAGEYAFVAVWFGLLIVDVSTPSTPTLAGFCDYDTLGGTYDVAVAGAYAYAVAGYAGLRVVDVSNPSAPVEVGVYDLADDASCLAVAGAYAYVADDYAGLRVVDVSAPSVPAEMGLCDTPWFVASVAVDPAALREDAAGGYAYVADAYAGLRVVDVSVPSVPIEVGAYDTGAQTWAVAIAGNYAFVADENGLRVVNVSTPSAPAEVGSYDMPREARGVAVAIAPLGDGRVGEVAFVVDDTGLWVVDVSTPSAPAALGYCPLTGTATGVAVRFATLRDGTAGGYAYVAAGDAGLRVVDVSTPAAPVEVSSSATPGKALAVAIAGEYAYVADHISVRVVDVSTPAAPRLAGFYDTAGYADGVAVQATLLPDGTAGEYAYVADGAAGLLILSFAYTPPRRIYLPVVLR
jgi:hypothetical protein